MAGEWWEACSLLVFGVWSLLVGVEFFIGEGRRRLQQSLAANQALFSAKIFLLFFFILANRLLILRWISYLNLKLDLDGTFRIHRIPMFHTLEEYSFSLSEALLLSQPVDEGEARNLKN